MLKLSINQETDVGDHSSEVCSMCKKSWYFPFAIRLIGSVYDSILKIMQDLANLGNLLPDSAVHSNYYSKLRWIWRHWIYFLRFGKSFSFLLLLQQHMLLTKALTRLPMHELLLIFNIIVHYSSALTALPLSTASQTLFQIRYSSAPLYCFARLFLTLLVRASLFSQLNEFVDVWSELDEVILFPCIHSLE